MNWAIPKEADIIQTAIDVADLVIIPSEPSGIELSRIYSTIDSIDKGTKSKVLFTKADKRTNSFKEVKNLLLADNIEIFDGHIPKIESIKTIFLRLCFLMTLNLLRILVAKCLLYS